MLTDDRQYKERLKRARRRIGEGLTPAKCAVCGHVFTDREIMDEDLVYSVSHLNAVQYCKDCFRKSFLGGVERNERCA